MLVQSVATDYFCQQKPQRNSGILGSKTSQAEASSVDEMATRKRRQLIIVSWLCWLWVRFAVGFGEMERPKFLSFAHFLKFWNFRQVGFGGEEVFVGVCLKK